MSKKFTFYIDRLLAISSGPASLINQIELHNSNEITV